jgi:cytochrome c553
MRKLLKYAGYTLGGLVVLLLLVAAGGYLLGGRKLGRTYAVQPAALALPSDSAALARGAYLVQTNGCRDCHGEDLAGQVMIDAPPFHVVTSNLTRGAGGIGDDYTDADWDRAIRHGVRPDGRPLIVMPSAAFHALSDRDAAALIAFLKTVPPVDNELPPTEVRTLGRLLVGLGQLDPAMEVRTTAARAHAPDPTPTAEYGAYLASVTCQYCHGADLRGGQPPEPGAPPAPDLATAGQWPLATFKQVLRTGRLPGGRELNPAMPISFTRQLTDDDLAALHAHFATLGGSGPTAAANS